VTCLRIYSTLDGESHLGALEGKRPTLSNFVRSLRSMFVTRLRRETLICRP
jgi:hypothetical protein